MFFPQESKQVCHYEMQGPGIPPLHNTGSLSASSVAGSSSGQTPESPSVGAPHMHPHLTSGKNLEIIWSKSHLVMRMIEMRIGQEPLLQVCALWQICKWKIHNCNHKNAVRITQGLCAVSTSEWQQYYYRTTTETFNVYATRQVFNKLLSLANSAAQPKADYSLWTNLLLSTGGVRLWKYIIWHELSVDN